MLATALSCGQAASRRRINALGLRWSARRLALHWLHGSRATRQVSSALVATSKCCQNATDLGVDGAGDQDACVRVMALGRNQIKVITTNSGTRDGRTDQSM